MSNRATFLDEYRKQLERAHAEQPEVYAWPTSELPAVFGRMAAAIERGTFNKDSLTFRRTCKALKIKHTYRDIECFLGEA